VSLIESQAPRSALIVLSGGMDSTTLLALALHRGVKVRALSVDYGQRHVTELSAAADVAHHYKTPLQRVRLPDAAALHAGSALTTPDIPVPDGHYAAESMRATVVPNRNMILLALAIGHAMSQGLEAVAYGAHAGDHAIYPDCRPEFADTMARAASLATDNAVALWTPFLHASKADIARLGAELHVPYSLTYSCYKGARLHCGTCGTCTERREAFSLAGLDDPTWYRAACSS